MTVKVNARWIDRPKLALIRRRERRYLRQMSNPRYLEDMAFPARPRREAWPLRHAGLVVGTGVAVAAVLTLLALQRPQVFADYHAPTLSVPAPPVSMTPDQQIAVRNQEVLLQAQIVQNEKNRDDAKTSGREAGLKLAAGVGALAAALLAWGRLDLTREERRLERATHNADRYSKAIEQVGSQEPDLQLGGIYALLALGENADDYAVQISGVLCAFVRTHSTVGSESADSPSPPVAAAVLGLAAGFPGGQPEIDLRGAHLYGLTIQNAHWENARFDGANMTKVKAVNSDFRGASFKGTDLTDAQFRNTYIDRADFDGATLTGWKHDNWDQVVQNFFALVPPPPTVDPGDGVVPPDAPE